jgi:hypothetical protein
MKALKRVGYWMALVFARAINLDLRGYQKAIAQQSAFDSK